MTVKSLCIVIIVLFSSCDAITKKEQENPLINDHDSNTEHRSDEKPHISTQTTNNLCQIAEFLENQNFVGDFYIYNGSLKWGMDVDSITISNEMINQLINGDIEYIARARGIIEFGFSPTKNGERGLLLNTEPVNPLITSGNVKPEFIKLDNPQCLGLKWYYQTY